MSLFLVLELLVIVFTSTVFCIEIPVANSVDPDQMQHFAASEQGLHCLHMSHEWVSCLKRIDLNPFPHHPHPFLDHSLYYGIKTSLQFFSSIMYLRSGQDHWSVF